MGFTELQKFFTGKKLPTLTGQYCKEVMEALSDDKMADYVLFIQKSVWYFSIHSVIGLAPSPKFAWNMKKHFGKYFNFEEARSSKLTLRLPRGSKPGLRMLAWNHSYTVGRPTGLITVGELNLVQIECATCLSGGDNIPGTFVTYLHHLCESEGEWAAC